MKNLSGNDPIKHEALQKFLCDECLENPSYRLDNKSRNQQVLYCQHHENVIIFDGRQEQPSMVFRGIRLEDFCRDAVESMKEAVTLETQREANLN